jgi:phage repressor protein C with HTH and peptisase S24 domain
MQPTIHDGGLPLIDTTGRIVRNSGNYGLDIAGERLVRRVQRKLDGSRVLLSDNAANEADRVPPERTGEVSVTCREVWGGGMI